MPVLGEKSIYGVASVFWLHMWGVRPELTREYGQVALSERSEPMACNGFNPPPDCQCPFRGGHGGSALPRPVRAAPLLGALAPPVLARSFKLRPKPCPKCGQTTYFVRAENGGRYRAAADGSMLRHNCPKETPHRPLRHKRASSTQGWFSATLMEVRARGGGTGQALLVTSLVGRPFRVRLQDGLTVDPLVPALCHWSENDRRVLEIAYQDRHTGELTETRIYGRRLRGPG